MSSPISVVDALTFIDFSLRIYKRLKNAPEELSAAKDRVEQIQTILIVLGRTLDDKTSLLAQDREIRPVIYNELERLDEDLQDFRDILKRYDQRDRVSMLERLKYASLDKSRLEDLQSKFSQSKERIGDMLKLSNVNANDVQIRKVDQILEKQDLESQARKTERCERQEDSQQILAAINRLPDRLSTSSISATPRTLEQIIDSFESELRNKGLPEDKAKGVLLRVREELHESFSESSSLSPLAKLQQNTQQQGIPPVEAHSSQRSISQPRGSRSLQPSANSFNLLGHLATEQKASQPLNLNISNSLPSKPPTSKTSFMNISNKTSITPNLNKCSNPAAEDCRILCVDLSHGIRSSLSHTFLEIVRVRIAMSTGRWLFKRVDSAGLNVGGYIRNAVNATNQKGIQKIVKTATDCPSEAARIAELMKTYVDIKISPADFITYHYILSYHSLISDLSTMRNATQIQNPGIGLARIIALEGCNSIGSLDCERDERHIDLLIPSIKAAIVKFISQPPFNWSMNEMQAVPNRHIFQFVTITSSVKFLVPGEPLQGERLREVERQSGCSVKATAYRIGLNNAHISIIGHTPLAIRNLVAHGFTEGYQQPPPSQYPPQGYPPQAYPPQQSYGGPPPPTQGHKQRGGLHGGFTQGRPPPSSQQQEDYVPQGQYNQNYSPPQQPPYKAPLHSPYPQQQAYPSNAQQQESPPSQQPSHKSPPPQGQYAPQQYGAPPPNQQYNQPPPPQQGNYGAPTQALPYGAPPPQSFI